MARLTFPDQQQDLQNAAGFSLASECDGSVKFPDGLWKHVRDDILSLWAD